MFIANRPRGQNLVANSQVDLVSSFESRSRCLLSISVTLSVIGLEGCKKSESPQSGQAQQGQPGQAPATQAAVPTADQLYQLVAPIALFPDNLVAQVLAGSTFPDEISAAYTWLQQNSGLKGQQLLDAVNGQSWDASVKGLTQFPDVLNQMATNLSWTSALGDAYYNYPQQRDECRAGDAPARTAVRKSEEHAAADGVGAEPASGRGATASTSC